MVEHIEDEEEYLYFFHQLLEYERLSEKKKFVELNNFQIRPIEISKRDNLGKPKKSNANEPQREERFKEKRVSNKTLNINEIIIKPLNIRKSHSETFLMKLQLRRAKLNHLLRLCENCNWGGWQHFIPSNIEGSSSCATRRNVSDIRSDFSDGGVAR